MAILRMRDLRKLEAKEADKRLAEFRLELSKERANVSIGATVTSPGRVREIRRAIARILTHKSQKNNPIQVKGVGLAAVKTKEAVKKK